MTKTKNNAIKKEKKTETNEIMVSGPIDIECFYKKETDQHIILFMDIHHNQNKDMKECSPEFKSSLNLKELIILITKNNPDKIYDLYLEQGADFWVNHIMDEHSSDTVYENLNKAKLSIFNIVSDFWKEIKREKDALPGLRVHLADIRSLVYSTIELNVNKLLKLADELNAAVFYNKYSKKIFKSDIQKILKEAEDSLKKWKKYDTFINNLLILRIIKKQIKKSTNPTKILHFIKHCEYCRALWSNIIFKTNQIYLLRRYVEQLKNEILTFDDIKKLDMQFYMLDDISIKLILNVFCLFALDLYLLLRMSKPMNGQIQKNIIIHCGKAHAINIRDYLLTVDNYISIGKSRHPSENDYCTSINKKYLGIKTLRPTNAKLTKKNSNMQK